MQIRCSNCFHRYDEDYGMCPNCGYVEGEQVAQAYCLAPGTRLADRYIIGQTLGLGGFGITYKAWDTQLEMVLAVKEYFPSGMVNRAAGQSDVFLVANKQAQEYRVGKKRFLDEARNLAKFSRHRNIVNVFNFFEANSTAYIVMEYLDGMTLIQTLRSQEEPMPADRCVSIAMDVCEALTSIHKEGILHRDVSPDNIMLCKDGTVKLFDFGAARFAMEAAEDARVTVIVKPGFAPPEQYDRINQQDARTDIYALGATLYYALTGVKPEESTDRRVEDTLKPPRELVDSIPEYVDHAIMRAMALDPRFRFEDAESFRKVLQQKIRVSTVDSEQKKLRRRRTFGIAGAVLLVAAAGLTAWALWRNKTEAATVPEGSVQLWYMTTGDEEKDQAAAAAWEAVTDRFMEEHPGVTVTALGVDREEYPQRLAQAQTAGVMPDIYESTALLPSQLPEAQSLSQLLDGQNDVYLDGQSLADTQYPTGLIVPAIYVNTALGTMPDTDDLAGLVAACEARDSTLLTTAAAAGLYQSAYGAELMSHIDGTALERFLEGECLIYLGTTADYLTVQEGMLRGGTGSYKVLFPETDTASYSYGCLWSCAEVDKDTTKIAFALLGYMNSDLGQDYFNIRNFAVSGCVPATRTGIGDHVLSYTELEGLSDYLGSP